MKACASVHIAKILESVCFSRSFVARKTSHLAVFFPVPRDPILACAGANQHPRWEAFPSPSSLWQPASCTGLTPQLGRGGFSSRLPASAARLRRTDITPVPEGAAMLLIFFVAAQHHPWEGHRQALMQFVATPIPVAGRAERGWFLADVSGYSRTQGKLRVLVRRALFNPPSSSWAFRNSQKKSKA